MNITRRRFSRIAVAATAGIVSPAIWASERAQAAPIRIGTSVSLTGPLAGSKNALIGYQLWRDDINAAGGLLGRQVEIVAYDDQSSPASVPSLYSKLTDIDKVDVLISPFGSALSAPIMPFVKQRDLFMIGMFALAGNDVVRHNKYFHSGPWGPNSQFNWTRGFFDLAKHAGCKRIAILAADVEGPKIAASGGRTIAQEYGMNVVYDQGYPPTINDFSSILRNIRAAEPDAVFVSSYPSDSVAFVRGLSEIGVGDTVKLLGGAMIGLQYASLLTNLGAALNGIVNAHVCVPEPTIKTDKIADFLARYEPIARSQGLDPLGHYAPPFAYVAGQMIAAAIGGAGSLRHEEMANYLHSNAIDTMMGKVRFNEIGDWTERRVLMIQFRDIKGKDAQQFRQPGKQVVLDPPVLATAELAQPFNKARSS